MRIPSHPGGLSCDLDRATTPMVDIVFQLLVFFVLASAGRVAEQSLSAMLSSGTTGTAVNQPSEKQTEVWIRLESDLQNKRPSIGLAGKRYGDIASFAKALRGAGGDPSKSFVVLDIAPKVPVSDVIGVYDACLAARYACINFAASPEELR